MLFKNTTIFDFETTGLKPQQDTIIEIAAIRIRNEKQVGTFSLLIDPEREVPEFITNLTGITNEDVKGQPTLAQALPFFLEFIGDSLLVAHNAAFDLAFLLAKRDEIASQTRFLPYVINDFIDTRTICIEHFPYQSHKLEVMCQQLGIKLDGAHRALNDVRATGNLLHKLNKEFGDAMSFKNKLYYFNKYGPPEGVPAHAELVGIG
jgi:DNA polymerase-3 subunit epsilon